MRYWTHLEVPGIRGENLIFHPKIGFFVTWVGAHSSTTAPGAAELPRGENKWGVVPNQRDLPGPPGDAPVLGQVFQRVQICTNFFLSSF